MREYKLNDYFSQNCEDCGNLRPYVPGTSVCVSCYERLDGEVESHNRVEDTNTMGKFEEDFLMTQIFGSDWKGNLSPSEISHAKKMSKVG